MKYLFLLLAVVSVHAFAATPTITGGDYVVRNTAEAVSRVYKTQSEAKSAALKMWNVCKCEVQIIQPVFVYHGPTISVQIIRPTQRKDGTVLDASEIGGYELKRNGKVEQIATGGDSFIHVTAQPALGEIFYLRVFDKQKVYSDYVAVRQ